MHKMLQGPNLCAIVLAGLLAGCAATGIEEQIPQEMRQQLHFDEQDHDLVAQNFVHTLAQLAGFSPIPTTVQIMQPTTAFGRAVERQIIDTGYGHQLVDGDMGLNFLRYRVESAETHAGYSRSFQLSVGLVELQREYRNIDNHLTPVSPMRISGTESNSVKLNDDIFRFNNPNEFESTIIALNVPAPPPVANKAQRPVAAAVSAAISATQSPVSNIKANVFDLRKSNYDDVFSAFEDVAKTVLPFNNNSYRIKYVSVDDLNAIIDAFDRETDIVSIVGCSLGNATARQSNEFLAKRRTRRVTEALVRGGVPRGKIYDESCWGDEYWDDVMPRRGAVLTVKRRLN